MIDDRKEFQGLYMMKAGMEWIGKFLRYLVHRFVFDKLSDIAATLTLTSLLALVPLLAVVFAILAALPFAQNFGADIQSFIFSNFVPAASQGLEQTLLGFVQKASNMKTLGFSSLVITAIMLCHYFLSGYIYPGWSFYWERRFATAWKTLSLNVMTPMNPVIISSIV